MSNTFLTTDLVVRDSTVILSDNLVMAKLSNRNHEERFAGKVGDTIAIKTPPVQTARDFVDDSGTTTDSNITESSVNLELEKWPYIAHTLTTKEKSLELDDFNLVVTEPAVLAIKDQIDEYTAAQAVRGFSVNTAGTEGTNPSTAAHMIAGRKVLQDDGCPKENRVGVINTTSEASFLGLDIFQNADYGSGRPFGLQEASMGRTFGCDWFSDQNLATLSRGDITEGTNVEGAGQSGTTLIFDKAGASTGTINEGARFTIAGDATVYTIMADVTAASNVFTATISPALAAVPGDGDAITWKSANTGNILYTRNALAVAIVAPAPLAVNSSSAYYDGTGMRVSMSSSTSTLSDKIVYDTFNGAIVIERSGGCVFQG